MAKKEQTILEMITPMIQHFDETHEDLDKVDQEDYVNDLMVLIESTVKLEAGLITEEEHEAIHVELERTICGRHHIGGAF